VRVAGKPWGLDRDPLMFETNVPGVFAAGDVRANANRRIAAAVGEGSAAHCAVSGSPGTPYSFSPQGLPMAQPSSRMVTG